MEKTAFQEKAFRNKEVARAKQKAYFTEQTNKIEANRSTSQDSRLRPFELAFGAELLWEINNYVNALDEVEFSERPYLFITSSHPLRLMCQKLLDWKVEVGGDRIRHELFVRYADAENNSGLKFVLEKTWEQVKKEQDIIADARLEYSARINQIRDANPKKYSEDPAAWIALCEGFSEFEALQEFGYPLPFNSVFGEYHPQSFNYGKPEDNNKFFGNQ